MAEDKLSWEQPHEISDLTLAFPASVVGTLLPPMSEIPDEFNRMTGTPWHSAVATLFYRGGKLPTTKPGIDASNASRHLRAVLGSFEPKHEHKMAGAAWLMSLWYSSPDVTKPEQ